MLSLRKIYRIKEQWNSWLWWTVLILVTILRLVLSGRDEIVPNARDARAYARMSMNYLSGTDELPRHRPGMGIIAMAAGSVGVPYKLLLDAMMILTAYCAGCLIKKISSSVTLGLLTYTLIIFSPWFMNHSREFMTEPIIAVLLLALVVFSVDWMLRPVHQWSLRDPIITGLISVVGVLTRPESGVVYLFWCIMLVVGGWINHKSIARLTRRQFWQVVTFALMPLAMVFVAISVVKQIHMQQFGVRALSASEGTGEMKLLSALYSIVPEEEARRFVPVTRETLKRACRECPTLAKRESRLLNTNHSTYQFFAFRSGIEEEVGTWLNWLIWSSFGGMNEESNAEMLLAVDEIRQAQAEGRLGYRFARFPIDPCWRQWVREIPSTVLQGIRHSVCPNLEILVSLEHFRTRIEEMDELTLGDFEDGLRLRRGSMPNEEIRLHGFLRAKHCAFTQVLFHTNQDRIVGAANIEFIEKTRTYQINFSSSGFRFDPDEDLLIEFRTDQYPPEGPQKKYPLKIREKNPRLVLHVKQVLNEQAINERWVFRASGPNTGEFRLAFKTAIRDYYFVGMWFTVGVSFFIGCLKFISARQLKRIIGSLVVSGTMLLARTSFYALVEIWLQWNFRRYVEPNHFPMLFLMVLLAFAIGAGGRRWYSWRGQNTGE